MSGCAALVHSYTESARILSPPPKLTIAQWADLNRQLSRESSAAPGQWRTDRAPYQRGIMDAISDPRVSAVVAQTSSQVGKTSIIENVIGFHIDQDPAPMLVIMPTLELAEAFSKDRLAPMIRDTPALRGRVADVRARDSGNTLLHKRFAGGHLTLAGANSAASLASRPIRIALCDEVDRFPSSAGAEGDPVELTRKRLDTFFNSKLVLTSTPTVRNASRIEAAYKQSDQRRYWVPCPTCHEMQTLEWRNVRWPEGRPREAHLYCEACGVAFTDGQRSRAMRLGEWRAEAPFEGVAGFHLNVLYSPWRKISDTAVEHQLSHGAPERMKVFFNTRLAETWGESGEGIEPDSLVGRAERYEAEVPDGALVIASGVDVQKDRLECEVVAFGADDESWGVAYLVLRGDPTKRAVWDRLAEEVLGATYQSESGVPMRISAMCVDEGYATTAVRAFSRRFPGRVYATKGMAGAGRPIISAPHKAKAGRGKRTTQVFTVGVDEAKTILYGRLGLEAPGPGYCHFPVGRGYDSEFFQQLTAEEDVIRSYRGFPRREWIKVRARNEALDCRVYAMAAIALLNPRYEALIRRRKKRETTNPNTGDAPEASHSQAPSQPTRKPETRPRRPANDWVNRWRR